jgi:segregation and condensation protein B
MWSSTTYLPCAAPFLIAGGTGAAPVSALSIPEKTGRDWLAGLAKSRSSSESGDLRGGGGRFGRRTAKMARLEALLLIAGVPLSARRLSQVAALADSTEARTLINRLNSFYEHAGTPFRVERVAAGYRLLTLPQFAFWLGKLHHREAELKLSPPAMETLTVVAYRQPITRADIESIRGVQCAEMLKQLMERGLVRIGGEDDSLGRPFLYETTRKFLETFGLKDLEDLPLAAKLRRPGGTPQAIAQPPVEEPAAEPAVVAEAS